MLAILAIVALPVGFIAGGVAVNSLRQGDVAMMWKSVAVFAICCLVFISVPKSKSPLDGGQNCHVDWDGFSNSTVCD
jgi:hypothetical protein